MPIINQTYFIFEGGFIMKPQFVLGLCISLLLAGSLSADTTFTNAIDKMWSNVDNWSDGFPDNNDKIRIVDGADCVLDIGGQIGKHIAIEGGTAHLTLLDGAEVAISDWTIIGYAGGDEGNPHLLEILGGVLNANARVFVGFLGYGKLVVDYEGVLNVNAQGLAIGENTDGNGRVEVRGGEINLYNSYLRFNAGQNSVASMDFSGGVLTQAYSDDRLAYINDRIANGTITAYGAITASYGAGTVLVETVEDTLIVKGLHPFNPVPEDNGGTVPGTVTLEWTVDAGTPVDVWFGTKADLSDFTKIVDKQAVTSTTVTTVAKQRYFWAVDTYAPDATQPEIGIVFDFTADNQPPIVDVCDDVITWLENGSVDVALTGIVTDDDPTTTVWTVVSQPDDPNSPDAAIADPAALSTTITLSALGEYVLKLQADDGEYQGEDTMTINVFSDSCEAAKSLPDYVPLVGDLDEDCDVDQDDLDLLMENWLKCVALGECDPNDPNTP
jgi:hypothetical protein